MKKKKQKQKKKKSASEFTVSEERAERRQGPTAARALKRVSYPR